MAMTMGIKLMGRGNIMCLSNMYRTAVNLASKWYQAVQYLNHHVVAIIRCNNTLIPSSLLLNSVAAHRFIRLLLCQLNVFISSNRVWPHPYNISNPTKIAATIITIASSLQGQHMKSLLLINTSTRKKKTHTTTFKLSKIRVRDKNQPLTALPSKTHPNSTLH